MKWVLLLYLGCAIQQPDIEFTDHEQCLVAGGKARQMMRFGASDVEFGWACVEAMEDE